MHEPLTAPLVPAPPLVARTARDTTPVTDLLRRLPDGTVTQRNPFTGTEVRTVPGRGHRPLGLAGPAPQPVDPAEHGRRCAFCERRYLETPPERSRVVRRSDGAFETLETLPAEELFDTVAEFRRVPNLFEILSLDYWRTNHGHVPSEAVRRRRDAYRAADAGRAHVLDVVGAKLRASGLSAADVAAMPEADRLEAASGFFGGGHDVIVARRHLVDGAGDEGQLAGAGTLTPDEHHAFVRFAVESAAALYETIPQARYVSVFQNWLKPAGASFDHLHKQLVAVDSIGGHHEAALAALARDPDAIAEHGERLAARHGLIVAENEHAVLFAGVGHRYPSLELHSRSRTCEPWAQDEEEVRGVSDLLHAAHAATGADVPCNEEWHTRPPGVDAHLLWRIVLKWRVSTLAGFEGATKIYLTTLSPWDVRDRTVAALNSLRERGRLADGIRVGEEALPAR